MIQESEKILEAAGGDSITAWAVRLGVVALFTYIWRNERYQHRQDLALLKLESDRDHHSKVLDEIVPLVTRIDRLVRRIAVSQNIHVREDD